MLRHALAYVRSLLRIPSPLEQNLLYVPRYSSAGAVAHYANPVHHATATPYVLITGATDGIGESLAIELASTYGFNIVLHGRSQEKLDRVRNRVITASMHSSRGYQQGTVNVVTICADAGKADKIDWQQFVRPLEGLNVSMVINNVGTSTVPSEKTQALGGFRAIETFPEREVAELVSINVTFPMLVTKNVLPYLRSSPTKRSLIVNISSAMARYPMPYLSVYCGAKAAMSTFLESLRLELGIYSSEHSRHATPVDVQDFTVAAVRTKRLQADSVATPDNPDAATFAKSLCRVLGDGQTKGTGYFIHAVQIGALAWVPRYFTDLLLTYIASERRRRAFGSRKYVS